MSERAILLVLDAQSMNARQARLNEHQEQLIGRAAGLVGRLRTTNLSAYQLAIVDEAVALLREFWKANLSERDANAAERECERTLAGLVEDARPQGWSVKRAARILRAPLGDLCNPIVGGTRRNAAAAIVEDFIATAPARLLSPECVSLRHELGVAKFTALHELIADRPPVAA